MQSSASYDDAIGKSDTQESRVHNVLGTYFTQGSRVYYTTEITSTMNIKALFTVFGNKKSLETLTEEFHEILA